jgi:uncharacterized membrane protein
MNDMNELPLHPHRSKPLALRLVLARPRLFFSVLVGALVALLLPSTSVPLLVTRIIVGWNVGAVLYLLLALKMMFGSSHAQMRSRAVLEDEGSKMVLVLVVTAALMCIGAIVVELSLAKDMGGAPRYAHIGLVGLTIATSWAFTHTMFALHYAHDYYLTAMHGQHGGLEFPGGEAPDYGDFLYFSLVIGTSAQTADVSITNRTMRRTGTLHCVLSFFFNTSLLALGINIASGFF